MELTGGQLWSVVAALRRTKNCYEVSGCLAGNQYGLQLAIGVNQVASAKLAAE